MIWSSETVLTLALTAVGILFGWLFTFVYYRKAQSSRSLCYAYTRDIVLRRIRLAKDRFKDLKVLLGDRELLNPRKTTTYVWNNGTQTIDRADISQMDGLRFGAPNIEILRLEDVRESRPAINSKISVSEDRSHVNLDFDFLDPNDGFSFSIVYDAASHDDPNYVLPNPILEGTIKGMRGGPSLVTYKSNSSSKLWAGTFTPLLWLFFIGCAVLIGYDVWQEPASILSAAKVVSAIILAIIGIVSFIIWISVLFEDRKTVVPANLRSADGDSMVFDDGMFWPEDHLREIEKRSAQ